MSIDLRATPRLLLSVMSCGVLFAATGCGATPEWTYQGAKHSQRVSHARLLYTSSPDYLHIGTLRGRSTAKGRRPEPFEDKAKRQAALRGGDGIVHLGGGVRKPKRTVGPENVQPDPRLLIREHSWAVYRLRKPDRRP